MAKKSAHKKGSVDSDAKYELARVTRITEAIVSVFTTAIKWGGLTAIFYFCADTIQALAGKETISNIALSLVTDLKANQYFSYLFGASGVAYGLAQQRSKKNTIERLQSRKKELEKKIDPGRKSSKLTKRGDTRPEDKP